MEDLKAKKFGPACGKHASSTFYKAFKLTKNGKSRVIALGQFFFMKILKGIPVCIGELQLVWEDKTSSQDLSSVRLYFLPECTPEGRQSHHGEDEVLAYSEKIVLKLDDLATLIVEDVSWSDGRRAFTTDSLQPEKEHGSLAEAFNMNSFGMDNRDIHKEAAQIEDELLPDSSPSVMIMSYTRYCRYRGILKRLENSADKWMRHAVVAALGGFHTGSKNNRIYFCRDLFDHADLDDFELRCDHLAPNLKGRPRKRAGSKQGNGNDSSEDSSCSSSFSPQLDGDLNKIRTGARATPLRNGFRVDKERVSKDEQALLIDLHKFMKGRGTPIGRIPSLGFKQIDLYQFYSLAEDIGGYEQICAKRMWKNIYDALGGNPGSTSAATYTRRHYEKLLLPYERYTKACDIAVQKRRQRARREEEARCEAELMRAQDEDNRKPKEEVKENIKQELQVKEEPKLNGHSHMKQEVPLGNLGNQNSEMKARALIIKQEIEKMKMRKDAQKHGEKDKVLDKEKVWEERRKNKLGDKVRKPSGCQKTVRELLDQNGRDLSDLVSDKTSDYKPLELKRESSDDRRPHSSERKTEREKSDLSLHDKKVSIGLSLPGSFSDPRTHQSALLSPLSQHHHMPIYPHFLPMGGVAPMAMPFMLPQMPGIQSAANPVPAMHSLGNPLYKDNKSLHALSKLVTEQRDKSSSKASPEHKSAIAHGSSKHRVSNMSPLGTPPSAHSQPPKPLTSPTSHTPQRPITPAHSNNLKRSYPYMDKTPPFSSAYPESSKGYSDPSHKRSKLATSQSDSSGFSSTSGQLDIPVLDLSMKTLRAQEERQLRGESLLFNTRFNKENRSTPKGRCDEAPQDLSLKTSSYSAHDILSFSHSDRCSTAPLNIPHFRSPIDQISTSFSIPVLSESHKRDSKHKSEKHDSILSPSKMPPIGPGTMATIGGLPIDLASLVHPAFPQQMLMQGGIFPTPLQLQQMIQGQVASMVRPDFIPTSLMSQSLMSQSLMSQSLMAQSLMSQPLMFPPMTSVPATFTSPSTSVKSSSSTPSSGSKR